MQRVRQIALCLIGACTLAASQGAVASAVTGSVVATGQNTYGQLGNGTKTGSDVPTAVSGLSDIASLDGRERGAVALLGDGTPMAWGSNEVGQLGNGTTEASLFPTPVSGLSEVKAISSYGRFTLALLTDGTVMAWGANTHGQLGNGTTEDSDVPIAVPGLSGVVAIAAGEAHSLALLEDGEVLGWGSNAHGQAGNGSSEDSLSPAPVKGLSGVTAIAAGGEHSLSLTSSGAVWAWGNGQYGQIGESSSESHVPVLVPGLPSDITAIAAGGRHSLALRSGGTAVAWGGDEFGQLGNGKSGSGLRSSTPVAVSGLSGAVSISSGLYSNLALLTNKTVAAWGGGEFGQLGIGEEGFGFKSAVPAMMCGVLEAGGISAGNFAGYAFGVTSTAPCPAVGSLSPAVGPQAGGTSVTIAGSGFTGATAVQFGASNASSFTVDSSTQITAVAPSAIPLPGNGYVQVRVKTPAGISPRSVEYGYQPPPSVEKIKPRKGLATGGAAVTIEGGRFAGEGDELQAVKFGSTNAASFSLGKSKGRTTLTAISPTGMEAGTVYVTLTTQWGTSVPAGKVDQFKVSPVVGGVSPSSAGKAGGATVTVSGAGFAVGSNLTVFKFGSIKAKSVSCASTTECSVVLGAAHAAGAVDVKATANKASSAKNAPADDFTYTS
jgi:alpha-tubulin suppressor-like RCC1 family protein